MVTTQKKIVFKKLENSDIFTEKFSQFEKNNEIVFSKEGIAVVYGPNGTGKTSLVNVLCCKEGTSYTLEYDGKEYSNPDNSIFHLIHDQNSRNIIAGTAKDFLLGDDIRREFDLKDFIEKEYQSLCKELIDTLKTSFNIKTTRSKLLQLVTDKNLEKIISDLANKNSKGKNITISELITSVQKLVIGKIPEYEDAKLSFFKVDFLDENSIIQSVCSLDNSDLVQNGHVCEIEENSEAIRILDQFSHKDQCIVCDTPDIDPTQLLEYKTANREAIIDSLSDEMKKIIEKIISITPENDPFKIKDSLLQAIDTNNIDYIISLKTEIKLYLKLFNSLIEKAFYDLLSKSQLPEKNEEYEQIVLKKVEIDNEDLLYLQEIINNSIDKELRIDRDDKKHIKIYLADEEFLEKERTDLPLSAGEQNFLSLTFEFLKAKNSGCQIVVLDDPISSFDSIYKNKIAYAIVRMLQGKNRLILTHNIDLIRLLEGQYKNCFNLHLLNNTSGELNGFIGMKSKEQDILINLNELLRTFRKEVLPYIKDVNLYLMAMIPFMRGYAEIVGNQNAVDDLTKLMHGYRSETVDVAFLYYDLFKPSISKIPPNHSISVTDILSSTVDNVDILYPEEYPILNRTLKHTFNYLFLRMSVEKTLVDKYNIDTRSYKQLGQIINQAFPNGTDIEGIRNRVCLTTKKTLLNEFNHFEGNLSIFQPAIDITDSALKKEKDDIFDFIEKIKIA